MNVIGHDHKFIHAYAGDVIVGQDVSLNDFSGIRQKALRGVEGAAPYNTAKQILPVLGTDGNEIRTRRTVIIVMQPCWFSLRMVHQD